MKIGRFNSLEGEDTVFNYEIYVLGLLHVPGSYGGKSPGLSSMIISHSDTSILHLLGSENLTR